MEKNAEGEWPDPKLVQEPEALTPFSPGIRIERDGEMLFSLLFAAVLERVSSLGPAESHCFLRAGIIRSDTTHPKASPFAVQALPQ